MGWEPSLVHTSTLSDANRNRLSPLILKVVAVISLPILVLLAFYSSLNVTATNGPLLPNFGPAGNLFNLTARPGQTSTFPGNFTTEQNLSFPNIFPNVSIPSSLVTALIIVLLIIVGLFLAVNLRWQSTSFASGFTNDEVEKQRTKVADILDKAVQELRQGSEYRRTVLECYKRICEILETRSKIDGTPLTAREFETSVVNRLKLDSPYLSQMTDVFEVARYSSHEISKSEADLAINCLENLSSTLRQTTGQP